MKPQHWLMKSEPSVFSIDDLAQVATEAWDGVRNYQARNYMRTMRLGDTAFFYHSNCTQPGIVGIIEIARAAYPDHTALDPNSAYFDPKSSAEQNRWSMVDVRFKCRLPRLVTLQELKSDPALDGLELIRKGTRLSIMPVSERHWRHIIALSEHD